MDFRCAVKEDVSTILFFIKQLAKYEKLEHEVVATIELLEQSLFINKEAEVIFVSENNKEVGFALFFANYSTFLGKSGIYLEDLFVLEEYRSRGYGKALLNKVKEIAIERNCGRLDWSCLSWNTPSIEFYQSLGARKMEDWIGFRLDGEKIK